MAYTTLPTQSAGQTASAAGWANVVKANFDAMGPHLIARTLSDVARTSTTLTDDSTLLTPSIAANEVWQLQLIVLFQTSTNDPLIRFTFPSTGEFTGTYSTVTINGWIGGSTTQTNGPSADVNNNAPGYPLVINAIFKNAGTPGPVTFQWASSAGVSVTRKANSTLWGVKLA